jgi:hypothetical protein
LCLFLVGFVVFDLGTVNPYPSELVVQALIGPVLLVITHFARDCMGCIRPVHGRAAVQYRIGLNILSKKPRIDTTMRGFCIIYNTK